MLYEIQKRASYMYLKFTKEHYVNVQNVLRLSVYPMYLYLIAKRKGCKQLRTAFVIFRRGSHFRSTALSNILKQIHCTQLIKNKNK